MSGGPDPVVLAAAMREVAEERPDLIEAPAGHEGLAEVDEDLDAAYWAEVERRAAWLGR